MRICYIGDGGSIHNRFMINWFVEQGHEVLFLTDTPDPEIKGETIQVVSRYGGGFLRHILAGYRARKRIRQWKPDIVHAHNITGYGYWGALCGFQPLVMTSWGSDLNINVHKSALVYYLVRYCLRKSRFITADAEALCKTVRDIGGQDIDVRLLQWGVDFKDFEEQHCLEESTKSRNHPDIVFISTRRHRPIYNIETIIRAFKAVKEQIPQSRLIVVGEDELTPNLKSLADDSNLSNSIDFTGWVGRKELIDLLCSADVFLSAPSSDSTALSLLEAFAAGLAVIVSDLPANYEWIEPGCNGYLVLPENEKTLAESMLDLAKNPQKAREWGEKNRKIVKERGDRDKEMRKLEEWYRELCHKNPGR